jgi:O-antigen ligase
MLLSILSGGRAMFYGILCAVCLYFILIKRKHLMPVLAAIIVAGCMYTLILPGFKPQEHEIGRVFSMEGGIKKQNLMRYFYYLYMWEVFKDNPLFGKGIGYQKILEKDEFFNIHQDARGYHEQLQMGISSGSHGSYMSILSTFGIGGLFFITVMVFGTIYYAYKIVIRNSEYNDDAKLALYIFMHITIMSVHMVTGGQGYSYRDIWFLPGIIAGIMAARGQVDKPETLKAERRRKDLEYNL